MAGGLLNRLRRQAAGLPSSGTVEQVVEHLHALLNTRQGNSALDPEYGLPDFTDMVFSFPQGGAQLCASIAKAIERYEPRLSNVVVEPLDDGRNDAMLYFTIRGTLTHGGGALSLQSSMTPTGQVRLR